MDETTRALGENDPVLRAAAQWALELDSPDISMERVTQWQHWLGQHPRHAQEFERIEQLLSLAERIRTVPWPTQAEIAADDDASLSANADAAVATAARARSVKLKWGFAMAASVTLVVGALVFSGHPRSINLPGLISYMRVNTQAGGTQKVVLADGSAIDVSGKSTLRATLTSGSRSITLENGEAFFRVAKDAHRPFTVHAGSTSITAIGTAFNVRRAGDRVVVAVAEGTVRIGAAGTADTTRTARLDAGEQAITENVGDVVQKVAIDVGSVASWRDGRLQYLNEPLISIAADVSRNTGRDIRVTDPSIAQLRITSTVLERNLDSWLQSLEEAFPVTVTRQPDGVIAIAARAEL